MTYCDGDIQPFLVFPEILENFPTLILTGNRIVDTQDLEKRQSHVESRVNILPLEDRPLYMPLLTTVLEWVCYLIGYNRALVR